MIVIIISIIIIMIVMIVMMIVMHYYDQSYVDLTITVLPNVNLLLSLQSFISRLTISLHVTVVLSVVLVIVIPMIL